MVNMNNMKQTGDACVGMVMARLIELNFKVLLPFGENHRYDLVVDLGGRFVRIQCKAGRMYRGAIIFNSCSTNKINGKWTANDYRGQIEAFAVYSKCNRGLYLIPVDHVGTSRGTIRLEKSKNNQEKGLRWAANYEMSESSNVDKALAS